MSTDYSELIERLRKSHWKTAPECADAIADLQSRLERYDAIVKAGLLNQMRNDISAMRVDLETFNAALDQLEAQQESEPA